MTPPLQAVLTGDIVRSSELSADEFRAVQDAVSRCSVELAERFPGRLPLPIEMFRGDSWQLLVTDPAGALRIALYIRAFLRAETDPVSVDSRVSIGVGSVETMPGERIGEGRGAAFRISGELLDRKSSSRLRFGIAGEGDPRAASAPQVAPAIAALLTVLDVLVTRWTGAQARAVCGALLDWTQEKIALNWPGGPITQQAAGQHLARAGWDGVQAAVGYYEEAMKGWLAAA